MYLIAGLGNPGEEYRRTRHNIGFVVIERLCRDLGVELKRKGFASRYALTFCGREQVALVCPSTFMNRSGASIGPLARYYNIPVEKILIVHDDLDLETGRVKAVSRRGAAGHKGVLSIIGDLGSNGFCRLRVGIGRPRRGENVEAYVLGTFYPEETALVRDITCLGSEACRLFVKQGFEEVMRHVNTR